MLSRADVEAVLDLDQLVDAVAQAMADLSGGRADMPARVAAMVEPRARFPGRDAGVPSFGGCADGEAVAAAVIEADHIHAEIGEIVAGDRPGRTGDDPLTLYKSVGVAGQDAAAASLVLQEARRKGIGREIDM